MARFLLSLGDPPFPESLLCGTQLICNADDGRLPGAGDQMDGERPHMALDDVPLGVIQPEDHIRVDAGDQGMLEPVPVGDVSGLVPVVQVEIV